MTLLDIQCISPKLVKLVEKRIWHNNHKTSKKLSKKNITRKIFKQPDKYLSQKELYKLHCNEQNSIKNEKNPSSTK